MSYVAATRPPAPAPVGDAGDVGKGVGALVLVALAFLLVSTPAPRRKMCGRAGPRLRKVERIRSRTRSCL